MALLGFHHWEGFFSTCGKQKLLSNCTVWASHGSGFSCCRAWALGLLDSVVGAPGALGHRLNSGHRGLVVREIFPEQGSNLCLPPWREDSYPLTYQRNSITGFQNFHKEFWGRSRWENKSWVKVMSNQFYCLSIVTRIIPWVQMAQQGHVTLEQYEGQFAKTTLHMVTSSASLKALSHPVEFAQHPFFCNSSYR